MSLAERPGPSLPLPRLLQRIGLRYKAGLQRCHVALLASHPEAAGAIEGIVRIDAAGAASALELAGFSEAVVACVRSQIDRWSFPGLEGAAELDIRIEMRPEA